VQAGDQARIRDLIETKLTPHFDIDRMTALAAGARTVRAPEQKKRLGESSRRC
jgi:phospholipid transport system substrate-binding protein